jgi:hypothetical protein
MWADERWEVKPSDEPLLLMGGGSTAKRLDLLCRRMIFFLKMVEAVKFVNQRVRKFESFELM